MNCWTFWRLAALYLGACVQQPRDIQPVSPEVVVAWNERVMTLAVAEDKLLTLKGVRAAAMMHIAMHDALNSIDRRYDTCEFSADAHGADPIAAAAQAAYEVAVAQYPAAQADLEQELQKWVALAPDESARVKAVATGKAAAAAILKRRADDGWNNPAAYKLQPMAPGVYAEFPEHSGTPQGFVFGAGWATVRPFALRAPDQFRSPPPPPINSEAYTRAFNEVKEVGRFQGSARTSDQTHLALWWKDFVENSHNRLARQLVTQESTDLWTAARLFALINMSVMDAYISVFDNKFFYNHWRPYTAIRWAANDGNPDTSPDPGWNNTHRHTYPFPSYPSAHGTACAAAMTIMADTFGDHYAFTMRTDEVDSAGPMSPKLSMEPPTRSFESFSTAAQECALSRLYLGIHFRYDAEEGNRLGSQVGAYVTDNFLKSAR